MITSAGAEAIFNGIANSTKIERINLGDNRITDEFVIWLGRHLKTLRLEKKRFSLT
jgi:hypothetical protein